MAKCDPAHGHELALKKIFFYLAQSKWYGQVVNCWSDDVCACGYVLSIIFGILASHDHRKRCDQVLQIFFWPKYCRCKMCLL